MVPGRYARSKYIKKRQRGNLSSILYVDLNPRVFSICISQNSMQGKNKFDFNMKDKLNQTYTALYANFVVKQI